MSRFIRAAVALAGALTLFAPTVGLARDLAQEERNRELVVKFYDGVFNQHEVEKGAAVLSDDYRQHNPGVPNGKKPFVDYFTGFFKTHSESHARIVRSAATDDLVWLHIHSTNGSLDRGRAIVDIFRVKNGKIVEHWDVIQAVPEKSANDNTMF
jgi:predicted SnoaL-like aldol condensation-catalyzing enzyme